MSKATKIWLIVATALTIVGIIIAAVGFLSADLNTVEMGGNKIIQNTYSITDQFDSVYIDTETTDINFVVSNSEFRVELLERMNQTHSVTVKDNTLLIKYADNRKWFEHISLFSIGSSKITVYLPEKEYLLLTAKTDTGDVSVTENFGFQNIEIETDTGDINAEKINSKSVLFSTDTGNIKLSGATINGELEFETNTGDVQISDTECGRITAESNTGNLTFKNVVAKQSFGIETDTGDVSFDRCDAYELLIETDTGNVFGTLLSDKIFFIQTNTGKINVPKSISGGKCDISTDTGDVKIKIIN